MKRGISPLIATVVLLGMTLVISLVVINFGINLQKSAIKNQETDLENLGLVNYRTSYQDSNCLVQGENCYRILVVNNEEFSIAFIVETKTSLGSYLSSSESFVLQPYQQNVFTISYPSNLGTENIVSNVKATKK